MCLILCCRLCLCLYCAPFNFRYISYLAQFVYLNSLIRHIRFYTLFVKVLFKYTISSLWTSGLLMYE